MQNHFSFHRIVFIIRTAGCLLALLFLLALGGSIVIRNREDSFLQKAGNSRDLEADLIDHLPMKNRLLFPSSALNQFLSRRYYAESDILVNRDGVLLQGSQAGSVDQALENVDLLDEYCRETGRDFLYVILPGKPFSDEELQHFGISCQRNATADRFREGLEEKGIPFLDARSLFRGDFYDMFYKTDHHWTAEAGLRTASAIVRTLNRRYGYSLREELLDPARYSKEVLPDFWTGEMGQKIFAANSRIRDDLVLLTPDFPVHLTGTDYESGRKISGGFDILTDPKGLRNDNNRSVSPYYYYLGGNGMIELENDDISEGSLLVIKDSFSNAMLPFLSLASGHITAWDMREDKGVYTYLDRHPEIKTVMIAYTISFVPTSYMNDFQRGGAEQTDSRSAPAGTSARKPQGPDSSSFSESAGTDTSSVPEAVGKYSSLVSESAGTDTSSVPGSAGTAPDDASSLLPPLQMEYLNRGTVAVKTGDGVFLSWRLLGTEPYDTAFEVLRNGQKIALVSDSTNYLDKKGNAGDCYQIRPAYDPDPEKAATDSGSSSGSTRTADSGSSPGELQDKGQNAINGGQNTINNGEEKQQEISVQEDRCLRIPLSPPEGGISPEGEEYNYTANDAACADLDGDGEYELILKWDPTNSFDSGEIGRHSGNVYIDAYKLDGRRLWRMDLGINIPAGAHFTQIAAYDFDLDGKAELAFKTAPGTKDGKGHYVSEASLDADIRAADNTEDLRHTEGGVDDSFGRALSGDEYYTVFEGDTGAAIDTVYYPHPRGTISEWGDDRGNRSERYLAAVAYLDGEHPSIITWRGYYQKTTAAAYRLINRRLQLTAVFDTSEPGMSIYEGQGNHNLAVADVDADGKDEIFCGSLALDDDFSVLWCSGRGHGDALHLADYDPLSPGPEYFSVHENEPYGMTLYRALDGKELFHLDGDGDTRRGVMAHAGYSSGYFEMWGAGEYASYGKEDVRKADFQYASDNFRIFWDGDLYDDLLDIDPPAGVPEGEYPSEGHIRIDNMAGCIDVLPDGLSNNGTKNNVCLSADLLGDWREEIVVRSDDGSSLLVYTTTIPTAHKLYTLMHDRAYRMQTASQNAGYNQPPHLGYYVSDDSDKYDQRKTACRIRTVHEGVESERPR